MKYAFMTFSAPKATLNEVLEMARQYGYDGIEPRSGHNHGVDIDADAAQRAAIRETFANSDIALCCIATSCRYADPETAPDYLEQTRQYIDLAGELGCPRLRVFGGQFPDGDSREDATARVAEALRSVADQARQNNVIICLETHDSWTDPSHVAEIMQRVDHPAIAVNWDVMHPQRVSGWSMDDAYHTLKPWIQHVHVHDGTVYDDGTRKLLPIGEGDHDHRRVIELLQADGYDGYISGEWINWCPPEEHLGREVATLRSYEK